MKILITGGAGFIGSRLTKRLLKDYPESRICILDNLLEQVHGPTAQFPDSSSSVICEKANIQDKSAVDRIVRSFQPTHVFHLAAETGTSQSMDEIQRYCEVNVQGTAILIEALTQHAPQLEQFVLSSSRAIYGEGPWQNSLGQVVNTAHARTITQIKNKQFHPVGNDGNPLSTPLAATELATAQPTSVYASTKLMQEYLVLQSKLKPKSLIYRFQNVYGAGQSLKNPYTGVLSIFTARLLKEQPIEVYEDGNIVRDFVHVDDIVDGLMLGFSKKLKNGEIINLGSGLPTTILEAAKTIALCLKVREDLISISGNFRDGDIRFACANIEKAQKILGWRAKTSLYDGIKTLVEWSQAELQNGR